MARITRRGLAGLGLAAPFLARQACAQGSYPDRPVRMIVPYSAGGVADTIARLIQSKVFLLDTSDAADPLTRGEIM